MVNRVNGQKYYEYAKINRQKRESTESSEFHMDPQNQGVIYEKSEEKKETSKAAAKEEPLAQNTEKIQTGVKIELSHQGHKRAEKGRQREILTEQVKKFAQTAITFLKALWDRVWNESPQQKETEFPEVLAERMEEAEEQGKEIELYDLEGKDMLAQSIYSQEEIRAIFRSGDQREIQDFLSNHGERHLAKNSDLLTQYDKRGFIVGINRSDKELILHGGKNEIKL